jgi:hypothetical protein
MWSEVGPRRWRWAREEQSSGGRWERWRQRAGAGEGRRAAGGEERGSGGD